MRLQVQFYLWLILCLGRQTQAGCWNCNSLDQNIHILLRGSKCDELQLEIRINGPVLLVTSIHYWTMALNDGLVFFLYQHCTYTTKQCEGCITTSEIHLMWVKSEILSFCSLIILALRTVQMRFSLWELTTQYTKEKKKSERQLGPNTQPWDSLPIKMIHSWTRKCFPYSTSGLRSAERVTDIIVRSVSLREFHSKRWAVPESLAYFYFPSYFILSNFWFSVQLVVPCSPCALLPHTSKLFCSCPQSDTESHVLQARGHRYSSDYKMILAEQIPGFFWFLFSSIKCQHFPQMNIMVGKGQERDKRVQGTPKLLNQRNKICICFPKRLIDVVEPPTCSLVITLAAWNKHSVIWLCN